MSSPLRHFRPINAPAAVRRAGRAALAAVPPVPPIAWGIRVHADEDHRVNERVEVLITPPTGDQLNVVGEVAWILALPPGAKGRFEAGLRVVALPPELDVLEGLLGP